MRLYLVQHGGSVDKSVDPDRPLSSQGEKDVECVASILLRAGAVPKRIVHSGKTRARQTAEIFDRALATSVGANETTGIAPLDSIIKFASRLPEMPKETMVCGHQPFLGRLVSHLLAGNEDKPIVEYSPASVACLEDRPDGVWVLCWFLCPELCHE
jgi:phosphohistidine phosphatase